jgi:hypothetical protein
MNAAVSAHPIVNRLRLPESVSWPLGIWLIAWIGLSLWALTLEKVGMIHLEMPISRALYYDIPPVGGGGLYGLWLRWDAIHYLRIALNGYAHTMLSAFYPLFPILGRTLAESLHIDPLVALILLSSLAGLGSMLLLYRIVADQFGPTLARRAVAALALYPFSFFLFAGYADSLALFFTLLAYDSVRRHNWLLAFLAGLAAGLSHPTVVPLILLLTLEGWRFLSASVPLRYDRASLTAWAGVAAVAAAPALGTLVFQAWRIQHGFPDYAALQYAQWGWVLVPPWQPFLWAPHLIETGYLWIDGWGNLLAAAIAILLPIAFHRRIPAPLLAYQACVILFLLSTTRLLDPFASWNRHSLLIFPIWIELALLTQAPLARRVGLAIGLALLLFFSGQFYMWGWVG